jgi:hypothetical protein
MKHKIGDMFMTFDLQKRQAVFFKIVKVYKDDYLILSHTGTSWIIDDKGIEKHNFNLFWDATMDAAAESMK